MQAVGSSALSDRSRSMCPLGQWSEGPWSPCRFAGFCSEYSRKVLSKLQACLERLKLLGCAFSAFHILRSCLSACKVIHLLRTLPFFPQKLAIEAQEKLRLALGDIPNVTLDETQWSLARLPVRRGGLGILDPVTAAAPAHVAAFLSSAIGASSNDLPSCKVPQSFFTALAIPAQSSPAHVNALRSLVRVGQPVAGDLAQRERFNFCLTSTLVSFPRRHGPGCVAPG